MMSITCVGIALLMRFIAVSSTVPFAQGSDGASKMFEVNDADAGGSRHGVARVDRSTHSVDPKEAFLAGEDTPVWVAYYRNPNDKTLPSYEKLEKGIVKEAIDYWKSNEFHGIFKGNRSNLEKGGREFFPEREEINDVQSPVSRVPEQRKLEANWTVYYPSVLAVMEYGETWPSDKKDERKLILERIIYALAYWNGVDVQLRPIENPWIRLRLAGIIIGRHRDHAHHAYEIYDDKHHLHYEGTLRRMGQYWGDRMRNKIDFQRGTYNIVALMTDEVGRHPTKSTVGWLFPNGLLCDDDILGATGVLITSDNLQFSRLQQVVGKLARMLGHGSDNNPACKYRTNWKSRAWNKCDLDSIRENLVRNGWCMEEPMEFHEPGKPVETVLPGMLTSLQQQCEIDARRPAYICQKWSCKALLCQNSYYGACQEGHPAMDGSECGVGMICLNGECVSNTIPSRS